ncbi:N-6 DNA methylase [Nocardiopsis sp. NPDC049922]|uniref:N-6 DNA methylase n=1 Tax=Nocardiopsis sp. NPDC049922 TaxID=3155157 RepID=UPI0033F862E0
MSPKNTIIVAAQQLADTATGHGADWEWVKQALMRQAANLGSARRNLRMPWPLPPGADVPADAAEGSARLLTDMDLDFTDMGAIGSLYETLLEHDLVDGRVVRSPDPHRRAQGSWYTPPELAAGMCQFTLGAALSQADEHNPGIGADAVLAINAYDPACGAGVFLVAAARWLTTTYTARGGDADTALPLVLTECIFGVDIDRVAVDLTRTALWWEIDGRAPITFMDDHVIVGNTLAGDEPPALAERYPPRSQESLLAGGA